MFICVCVVGNAKQKDPQVHKRTWKVKCYQGYTKSLLAEVKHFNMYWH